MPVATMETIVENWPLSGETREAIEKLGAEFVFEFANLLRERWLRHVLFFGRACEVSGASDGAKVSQLM